MTDGEWGIGTENPIGTLPSVTDWEEQTLDAANSFYSGQHSYEHKWQIDGFFRKFTENNYWEFDFDVPFRYVTKNWRTRRAVASIVLLVVSSSPQSTLTWPMLLRKRGIDTN